MKLLVAFLALLLTSSAAAAPWRAELGLGGTVVPGSWAPLRLSVPPLSGPWSLRVTAVSASGRTTETMTAHGAGGETEEPLYVAAGVRSLRLRFETAEETREVELSLAGRLFPGHVIGVDGLDPYDEAELADVLMPLEPVKVVAMPVSQWPASPLSYGGLAALAALDPGTLAPARLTALRAWVAAGGVLVIAERLPPGQSLLDQLGPVVGAGRAVEAPADRDWRSTLNLRPYGEVKRWGTDFDPPPSSGRFESPVLRTSLGFVLVWAVGVLAVRTRPGLKIPLLWAAACSAGAAVLFLLGWTAWDRGLSVHGRELVIESGRFSSVAAVRAGRQDPLGWPASPWALSAWREENKNGWARAADADHLIVETFLEPIVRHPAFRVLWDGRVRWFASSPSGWRAQEDVPEVWRHDEAWIARLVSSYPGFTWSGGGDAQSVWLKPEEGRP